MCDDKFHVISENFNGNAIKIFDLFLVFFSLDFDEMSSIGRTQDFRP